MELAFDVGAQCSTVEFIDLLHRSGLAERRPVQDRECMQGMIENSNLLVTARKGGLLVGLARSLSDFHYACYLSDLTVDKTYQRQGIGKELLRITRSRLGPHCKLILLSAPAAQEYYQKLGFENKTNCWVLAGGKDPI